MISDLNQSCSDATDKYGVSVSCRIPGALQKEIGNEAALRGISLARHLTSLIQTGHQQAADQNAEINILLREKENLLREIQVLTQQVEKLENELEKQDKDEKYFTPLRRNRDLLLKHQAVGSVLAVILKQEGFDFTFATQTMLDQNKQYFCILDMCYRQEKDMIIIKPLNA